MAIGQRQELIAVVDVGGDQAVAREWMASAGQLSGPALNVGDLAFQAGDRVVALGPDHQAGLVTSQRGTITSVDPINVSLRMEVDGGRTVTVAGEQLGGDRLGRRPSRRSGPNRRL